MIKKRSLKFIILSALTAAVAACLSLAACTKEFKPEDNGYSAYVTYDANGGRFGNSDTTGIKVFKYAPGKSIIRPGGTQTSQVISPILEGKHVAEWYPAVLDDDGNVTRDTDGKIVVSDDFWDFSADKLPDTEGYRLYLVARWVENFSFTVDVGEAARADGVQNIVNSNYEKPSTASKPSSDPVWKGHTFYGYYDESGNRLETESDWRRIEISENNPDAKVFAHWIDGTWTIVRSPENMSIVMSNVNYYIDADIDFAGRTITVDSSPYTGEFNGNGHTISGFTYSLRQSMTQFDLGVFRFGAGGKMHDITFKDCTASFTLTTWRQDREFNIGFLCGNGTTLDMANFKNIGFVGCKLDITRLLDTAGKDVNIGEGTSHYGIFGKIGDNQTFVPVENKAEVTVTLH